jgi:hypothetical protein
MTKLEEQQRKVFQRLVRRSHGTTLAKRFSLQRCSDYENFREHCPVLDWSFYQPYIERIKQGESNILTPGTVHRFAVSSGTTGSGKHIPIPSSRLTSDQQFMRSIGWFLAQKLGWSFLKLLTGGSHVSLPGSLEQTDNHGHAYTIGEITAHLADTAPSWSSFRQLISLDKLIKWDVQTKLDVVIRKGAHADVRLLTAAPCWIAPLFKGVIEETNANTIQEVWPNLKVIIAGGMQVSPYIDELKTLWGDEATFPLIIETYGASEGYLGFTQQTGSDPIRLVTDHNVFFEGIPEDDEDPIPIWEFIPGQKYQLVISTNSGLWRYPIGDRIEWVDSTVPALHVLGREDVQFDRFGEAVGLQVVTQVLQQEFSIQSVEQITGEYLSDPNRHRWWVLFDERPPTPPQELSNMLDEALIQRNRHYELRRSSGVLQVPEIRLVTKQEFKSMLLDEDLLNTQTDIPFVLNRS